MDSTGDRVAEIVAAISETRPAFTTQHPLSLPVAAVPLDSVEAITAALTAPGS